LAEWKTNDPGTSFNTLAWLTGAIFDCLGPSKSISDVLGELRERASATFRSHPALTALTPQQHRLSIVFLGYKHGVHEKEALPIAAVLSNFQDMASGVDYTSAQQEFFLHISPCVGDSAQPLSLLGATTAVSASRKAEIIAMIEEDKPLNALEGKAIQIVEEASDSPRAVNSVGPNVMVATLRSASHMPPHSVYRSATGGNKIHLLAMIDKSSGLAISAIRLNTVGSFTGKPRRNSLCSCGSGQKYKHCHGRIKSSGDI
jgi:hypothetical protein